MLREKRIKTIRLVDPDHGPWLCAPYRAAHGAGELYAPLRNRPS
jgi:hypothetical protein